MNLSYSKFLFVLALVVFFGLVIWGAQGVRGTDQYWYLADVSSLISTNTEITNIYYAGPILRNSLASPESVTPNYFLHNGPFIHLVASLGKHIGEYRAWIYIGIACHLLVAFCILVITRKYTSTNTAFLTTSLYLVSPIAFWQAINVLQEQFFAGIMAAIYLCFHKKNTLSAKVLIIPTICIGIASHPIFLILGIAYTCFSITESLNTKSKFHFTYACIAGILFMLVKNTTTDFFPSSFQPNLQSIVAGSIPGVSNMIYHYSPTLPEITTELFTKKVNAALTAHLLDLRNAPFYIYTNIAIMGSILLAFVKSDKQRRTIYLLCSLTLGLYLSIIVLMQAQARYQQIVAPATFVILGYIIHHFQSRNRLALPATAFLIGSVLINSYLANTARTQAVSQANDSEIIRNAIARTSKDSKFVSLNNTIEADLRLSHLIRPREILALKTSYLSAKEVSKVLNIFQGDYVITQQPSNKNLSRTCDTCRPKNTIGRIITKNLGELQVFTIE